MAAVRFPLELIKSASKTDPPSPLFSTATATSAIVYPLVGGGGGGREMRRLETEGMMAGTHEYYIKVDV